MHDKSITNNVREHYQKHLGNFYSWMLGDFNQCKNVQKQLFKDLNITPKTNNKALDLGAGNGIQSLALEELGFTVTALDFNYQLLNELKCNTRASNISIIEGEIENFTKLVEESHGLIICCGDTIAHLPSVKDLQKLTQDIYVMLSKQGLLLYSFRDYSTELKGENRFIPVKSDSDRILTCFLEYETERVKVSDILHEKSKTGWKQKISSYYKLRLTANLVDDIVKQQGFEILRLKTVKGMHHLLAIKSSN